MAVIKAINSKASLGKVIKYITQDEKTLECLIGGYNCRGTSALFEMKATKKAWDKTGGRQYKHFVQSFSPDEDITPQQAHGLGICQKTKGISTYNIHAYNAIKKDLDGTGKSWLLAIALAVRSARAIAANKTVFIAQLNANGISVKWEENRKYITFSDKDGHKVRCKKLTEMFKEDFSKEGLENDFRRNS